MKHTTVRRQVVTSVTTTQQVAIHVSRTVLLELLRKHFALPDDARFSIRVAQGEDCCDGELVVDDDDSPLVVTYQLTDTRRSVTNKARVIARRKSEGV